MIFGWSLILWIFSFRRLIENYRISELKELENSKYLTISIVVMFV